MREMCLRDILLSATHGIPIRRLHKVVDANEGKERGERDETGREGTELVITFHAFLGLLGSDELPTEPNGARMDASACRSWWPMGMVCALRGGGERHDVWC
jgi:hypothetical protein